MNINVRTPQVNEMARLTMLVVFTTAASADAQAFNYTGNHSGFAGYVENQSTSYSASAIQGVAGSQGIGLYGVSTNGAAVFGLSSAGFGVSAQSNTGVGLHAYGRTTAVEAVCDPSNASCVGAYSEGIALGLYARGGAKGLKGEATTPTIGIGVEGVGPNAVVATGTAIGVLSTTTSGTGVDSTSTSGIGVIGRSTSNLGVSGRSTSSNGVQGWSGSANASGVYGENANIGYGTAGRSPNIAVYGDNPGGLGHAGYFNGRVHVNGTFSSANKWFKIDHPADPANKFLNHSCVESSEYKNLYDGIVTLSPAGRATVTLPDWFFVLNKDFRYSLTPIGAPAQLYVARELSQNSFDIAGGLAGQRVSWQVSGVRKDPSAIANPLTVEELKPVNKQGKYLNPQLYGRTDEDAYVAGPTR